MKTAEETVLIAALEGDYLEVKRLLQQFLPGERTLLERACHVIEEVVCILEEEAEPPEGQAKTGPSLFAITSEQWKKQARPQG